MPATQTAPTIHLVSSKPAGMESIHVYSGDFDDTKIHWSKAEQYGQIKYIATYYAPTNEDGFVLQTHVRMVEALHPGMLYIYL